MLVNHKDIQSLRNLLNCISVMGFVYRFRYVSIECLASFAMYVPIARQKSQDCSLPWVERKRIY